MTSFKQHRSFSADQNYAIEQSAYIDARVLAANTAEVHTVPSGKKYVVFSSTDDFFAKMDGAAAIPATDVTDGSASELNPGVRYIVGVATIGLKAPRACTVVMSFYE